MSADAAELRLVEVRHDLEYETTLGEVRVELRRSEGGGSIVLVPAQGATLELTVQGDTLRLGWSGRALKVEAQDLELAGRRVRVRAEEGLQLEAGQEVDVHSGTDVEIRADHHVNLWGHDVQVGD